MFKNWKTTLVGALLACAYLFQAQYRAGGIDWVDFGVSALIILLGALAKDNDVTGGGKVAALFLFVAMCFTSNTTHAQTSTVTLSAVRPVGVLFNVQTDTSAGDIILTFNKNVEPWILHSLDSAKIDTLIVYNDTSTHMLYPLIDTANLKAYPFAAIKNYIIKKTFEVSWNNPLNTGNNGGDFFEGLAVFQSDCSYNKYRIKDGVAGILQNNNISLQWFRQNSYWVVFIPNGSN